MDTFSIITILLLILFIKKFELSDFSRVNAIKQMIRNKYHHNDYIIVFDDIIYCQSVFSDLTKFNNPQYCSTRDKLIKRIHSTLLLTIHCRLNRVSRFEIVDFYLFAKF